MAYYEMSHTFFEKISMRVPVKLNSGEIVTGVPGPRDRTPQIGAEEAIKNSTPLFDAVLQPWLHRFCFSHVSRTTVKSHHYHSSQFIIIHHSSSTKICYITSPKRGWCTQSPRWAPHSHPMSELDLAGAVRWLQADW